jgi:hypothetical protein
MNRYQASFTHFLISLAIAGLVYVTVRYLWYPGPLFEIAGGLELLLIVISVDVTLGPLVTMIVFKPGKPGLRFDLTVIGILQVAALAYGIYSIAESRPVFITFVKDRFELVRAGELDDADLAQAAYGFADPPWFGYRFAGAKIPRDPKEQLKLMDSAIVGGKDIHLIPRWYVEYSVVAPDAAKQAEPIAKLRKLNPDGKAAIDEVVARSKGSEDAVGFLPMRAGKRDMTVVVTKSSGDIVALLPLRPWEY